MGRPKRYCEIDECGRDAVGWGMCKMHWQRWRKWGDPRKVDSRWRQTDVERFWAKVDKSSDGCWLWTGCTKNGYGCFWVTVETGRDRMVQAHRFAYELARGPLMEGVTLDHLCHTREVAICLSAADCQHRRCVRPDHLEPMDLPANIRRGGNGAKTRCKRGHPFDEANTWVSKKGGRFCRTCQRLHAANFRARRRAERATSAR